MPILFGGEHVPRRSPVRADGTMSQRTVSSWSGVSAGTLKNLARIDLLPHADKLQPRDVVLAQVGSALGATRSTNRDTQQGVRTETANSRDWDAIKVVLELLIKETPDNPVSPRTRLVAFPARVELIEHDYELLALSEEALTAGWAWQVLPIGAWHADVCKRLKEAQSARLQDPQLSLEVSSIAA